MPFCPFMWIVKPRFGTGLVNSTVQTGSWTIRKVTWQQVSRLCACVGPMRWRRVPGLHAESGPAIRTTKTTDCDAGGARNPGGPGKKSLWRDAYSLQTFLSRLTCSGHRKGSLDTSVFEKLELTGSVRRNSLSTSVSIVVYFGVTVVPFRRKHVVQRVKFCMFVFRQFGFLKARSRLIERRTTCGSDTERWASCCEPSRPLRVIGHPGSLQARAHPSKTCRLSVQNEFNVWGHSTACVMSRLGTAQLCTNMLHDSFQLRVNINWTNLLRSSSDLLSGHDDDLWQTSIKAL